MKKVLRQYRYYGETNAKSSLNYPLDLNKDKLNSGAFYKDDSELLNAKIIGLKIQTFPGSEFFLNGEDSMIIGSQGIYELKIAEGYELSTLRFSNKTLNMIDLNQNAYLIVDMIFNVEE